MPNLNFVLQLSDSAANSLQPCVRFAVPGMPRSCRVVILSCDTAAEPYARDIYVRLSATLHKTTADPPFACGGPGLWGCMTWAEPGCEQILIPVMGQRIDATTRQLLEDWTRMAGPRGKTLPALLPGCQHGQIFANCPPALCQLNLLTWLGDTGRLASLVMQHATGAPHPSVFLSYRRTEAGGLADQLFDGLGTRGWRVFLDRFCGTSGRYFPHELAEEMAEKSVLIVLETATITASTWTMWEVAFAQRYCLGLVALNLPLAPKLARIQVRLEVKPKTAPPGASPPPAGRLSDPDVADALDFIEREVAIAGLRRRAFYETIVAAAAQAGGGRIQETGGPLLDLEDHRHRRVASVLPAGRPGTLADVHTLAGAPHGTRILIGQHDHLPAPARADLGWLAGVTGTDLVGRFDAFQRIRALC